MVSNRLNKIERAYFFTAVILFFHLTRNISLMLYACVLGAMYFYTFARYSKKAIRQKLPISAYAFIFTILYIPLISIPNIGAGEYVSSIMRYLVPSLFMLFSCLYQREYSVLLVRRIFQALCIFSALAALSIPFQILFGEVSFFADASSREGVTRYASLMGSLTSFGTCGAICVAILLFSADLLFKNNVKVILISVNLLGLLLSLQKASVINILILILLFFILSEKKASISVSGSFNALIILIMIFIIGYIIYNFTPLGEYIDITKDYTIGEGSSTESDFISRITTSPQRVYDYNKMTPLLLLVGIGFKALAGLMGMPYYPMSHNNYFDLLFSGGIINLITVMFLLLRIVYSAVKIKFRNLTSWDKIYLSSVIMILANMFIGAGTFYHPFTAIIFSIVVFSYDRIKELTPKIEADHKFKSKYIK